MLCYSLFFLFRNFLGDIPSSFVIYMEYGYYTAWEKEEERRTIGMQNI